MDHFSPNDPFAHVHVDKFSAIENKLTCPNYVVFFVNFREHKHKVIRIIITNSNVSASWLCQIIIDLDDKIVGFTTLALESRRQAFVIALSYGNNVIIYKIKEAEQMKFVSLEFKVLLNDVHVKLVGLDSVLNKILLAQLGYKVLMCEFLNIAHNLTRKRLAFTLVSMNEMLTEYLDLKYDEGLLPIKPSQLKEVLTDQYIMFLSLYSFGGEEIYLISTRNNTQISVLAVSKNYYLIEMGPVSATHSVVATVVSFHNVRDAKNWVVTVLHHNPKLKILVGFYIGRMRSSVKGKQRHVVLAFYFPRRCLTVKLGDVHGQNLLNAISHLLQDARVLLMDDKVQLNMRILIDIPYEIMWGCGTMNVEEYLVGMRRGLRYERNMISSLGLHNFNFIMDFDNDKGNSVLENDQIITTTMKAI